MKVVRNSVSLPPPGQSVFGADVYKLLRTQGHDVAGVFTIPDVNGKSDPLASAAEADNVPVFKFAKWRVKKEGKFQVCAFSFPVTNVYIESIFHIFWRH